MRSRAGGRLAATFRSTHTRTREALIELLNSTFQAARANWDGLCAELSIVHAASMLAEVMSNVKESVVMELLKNKVKFAFKKQRFEVFFPALSSRRQMLAGMKAIDDLHCTRDIVGAQAPNPGSPSAVTTTRPA